MQDGAGGSLTGGQSTRKGRVERLTGWLAVAGGCLALGVASLVVVSVLGRWLFLTPIQGDFEFVRMATALAVFACLPYTQARRGNIFVDTFTGRLPERARRVLDMVWDLAYGAMMALCAVGLGIGAADAWRNGETTMQLQLPVWPAIGVSAALCAVLVGVCLATAARLARRKA